jgi:hypothetical protein
MINYDLEWYFWAKLMETETKRGKKRIEICDVVLS